MWDAVLGHDEPKKFLQRYLTAASRPQSLLFYGQEGLGKKKLALHFAKTLLCHNHSGNDDCPSCKLMNFQDGVFSHPDFLLIEPEAAGKQLKIEQIKELIQQAAFAPSFSDCKVCLVDDADKMTLDAANCFLKLLEEPPAGWVIILLARTQQSLLPTILSRVVRLRFNPMPPGAVERLLTEGGIDARQAAVLARLGEGSVGRARTLAEEDVFAFRQTSLQVLEALPLAMPLTYLNGIGWLAKYERQQALLWAQLTQFLLRDMLFIRLGITKQLYNGDLTEQLAELAQGWDLTALRRAVAAAAETSAALTSNVGIKTALEAFILTIDNFRKE